MSVCLLRLCSNHADDALSCPEGLDVLITKIHTLIFGLNDRDIKFYLSKIRIGYIILFNVGETIILLLNAKTVFISVNMATFSVCIRMCSNCIIRAHSIWNIDLDLI